MVTATTLERGYLAFRGSGNLKVFQLPSQRTGLTASAMAVRSRQPKKLSTRAVRGPKALKYVDEAFGRLAERIRQLTS